MGLRHAQTDVKVNAQVDRGVAPLIEALSSLPGVYTVDSCEADERGNAYVLFTRLGLWAELGGFVDDLSRRLRVGAGDLFFTLALEWVSGGSDPLARVSVASRHVGELADALRSIAASYDTEPSRG